MQKLKQIGGDRAIVGFVSNGLQFNVYVPKSGSLSNIAGVLLAILPKVNLNVDAGELAADFISAVTPSVRCRLTTSTVGSIYAGSDVAVTVSCSSGKFTVQAWPIVNGKVGSGTIFSGSIADFANWTKNATGLEDIIMKTVQFKYNGGSHKGAIRTIRVENVVRDNGDIAVEGYDLEQKDLKHGYRRYLNSRIEGDIEVLN